VNPGVCSHQVHLLANFGHGTTLGFPEALDRRIELGPGGKQLASNALHFAHSLINAIAHFDAACSQLLRGGLDRRLGGLDRIGDLAA
jgi:hypothetical protein